MPSANFIRADFHNHTHYSPDSILSPRAFVREARRLGMREPVTELGSVGDTGERVVAGEMTEPLMLRGADEGQLRDPHAPLERVPVSGEWRPGCDPPRLTMWSARSTSSGPTGRCGG